MKNRGTSAAERLSAGGSFGPCLVVSRADCRRSGDHAVARGRIVEDIALGDRARSSGLSVACLAGRGTVSFRMYPEGLALMTEGWSKGLDSGAANSPALPRWLMTAWVTGAASAVVRLAAGVAALPTRRRCGGFSGALGASGPWRHCCSHRPFCFSMPCLRAPRGSPAGAASPGARGPPTDGPAATAPPES